MCILQQLNKWIATDVLSKMQCASTAAVVAVASITAYFLFLCLFYSVFCPQCFHVAITERGDFGIY